MNSNQTCPPANVIVTGISYDPPSNGCGYNFTQCNGTAPSNYLEQGIISKILACSDGSAPVNGQCASGPPPAACKSQGTPMGTMNFTIGYTRTPEDGAPYAIDYTTGPIAYAKRSFCIAGCGVTITKGLTGWGAQVPAANGMYRQSVDSSTASTGLACQSTDVDNVVADPSIPAPACPGTLGHVNGKAVCLGTGTAGNSVPPTSLTRNGNPVAGSSDSTPPNARTPAGGDGGNSGGPSGSTPNSLDGSIKSVGGTPVSSTGPQLTDCDKHPDSLGCTSLGTDVVGQIAAAPKLYTPKYPNGLVGAWNDNKAALTSSPIANLLPSLMPVVTGNGTCPSFHINLSFATWANFGDSDFSPPCYLWTIARAIILVSALLLARALIFGG